MLAVGREWLPTSTYLSLPKTFASGDANESFEGFEVYCRANEWSDDTKAQKLLTLLEGEALTV